MALAPTQAGAKMDQAGAKMAPSWGHPWMAPLTVLTVLTGGAHAYACARDATSPPRSQEQTANTPTLIDARNIRTATPNESHAVNAGKSGSGTTATRPR